MLSEKIRDKFQKSTYITVKDFQTTSKCPLSLETLTSVINRGKEPSIPAFIQMAYSLGLTPGEISETCKAAGDNIFWRLIDPSGLTDEDKAMVDKIKSLSPSKRKLVKDLLNTLGV